MSSPFPKRKEKRPRSPSEPNNSFVKNVTSRVSGLLPATIIKWFSSPSSSNTNGSAPAADATDSSTEDEAPESPLTVQPPAKKIRLSAPAELVPVETRSTSTNTESIDEIYTAHSPMGRSNPGGKNIFASTRIHSANDDTTEETIQDIYNKPQHSISTTEQSVTKKRKSIFGIDLDVAMYKRKAELNYGYVKEPYFKPSLIYSPFYGGRTMYGGASSSYLTPTSIQKKAISITNETSNKDSVNMSHSARRVMDLLDSYSSPLKEAKRIPQTIRNPDKLRNNSSFQKSVNTYSQKAYSYKTQELYVPSVASILTIKRQSRLMDTTNAARQIIASHSSSSEFLPYPKTNSGGDTSDEVLGDKLTTKVMSRLTRTNRERHIEMDNNISETVNLPNVILQIDKNNLPKFTFGPVSTSQTPRSSSIKTPVIITPEALKKNTESDKPDIFKPQNSEKDKPLEVKNNNNYFKYSAPIPVSSDSSYSFSTPPKFIFGSPDRQVRINKNVEVKTSEDQLSSTTSDQINVDNKLPDCLVLNNTDAHECDDIKKCSSCTRSLPISQFQGDICTDCENMTMNLDDSPSVSQDATDTKWKCKECKVYNLEDEEECSYCCGYNNPKKIKSAVVNNPDEKVESEWKCNDCWIKNKSTLSKCAACGGSKPGSQTINKNNSGNNALVKDNQGESKVKETLDSTFSLIAKSQSERWKCPLCLVRNESNRNTCICCEANKPGTERETQKFNFHQPSEITFKFGIQPKNQENCADIEPEECNMGEDSETNNNILPKTTFNFGLPLNKLESQSLSMDKLAEVPKINFTFGLPKADQTSPARNNIFGITNKPIETSKSAEENPQEVPQVFTPSQSDEHPKNNLGLFNTPVKSHVAPEMPALVPLHLINQNSAFRKDLSILNPSFTPTTSSETKTQQSNFTFPSIRVASNLFAAAPTTTSAESNILPGPLSMSIPASTTISIFEKPNTVTTTTSSFFQKSDSNPRLGIMMFPKTENTTTTTTTSSAPMGTMLPIFGFGGQGTVPQTEKPKFSFNFASNKTDPAIFKTTFAGTSVNSIPSNKFNLPSNSIIGGNALSGNLLNNTTQINPLTTSNSISTPPGSSIFGAAVPKDNMWSSSTNNLFGNNSTTNGDPNPQGFAFGTSTPFSANNAPFGSPALQAQGNNAPFGSTTQTQPNNAPFGTTTQTQPNNVPFGSTTQTQPSNVAFGSTTQTQPNNVPFGSTNQTQPSNVPFGSNTQTQPNNAPFGSTTQTQPNNAPFGSTTQTQPNNAPFGSATQTQPNNAPFGSATQQAQPNNVPFGSTTQQAQPSNASFGNTAQQAQPNNNAPFGSTTQQTQATTAFGSTIQQTQPTQTPQNVFGIASQPTTSQPPKFGNHLQSQTTPNMFGGLQVTDNPMPMGIFGAPNQAVAPSFGALNPSIPTFEASTLPPQQPAPASFNFGGQPSAGVFGFGQQQQQTGQVPAQPENPPGMYGFGGPSVAAPQMQFTIGSAPNINVRRFRKAMRRTQR